MVIEGDMGYLLYMTWNVKGWDTTKKSEYGKIIGSDISVESVKKITFATYWMN